jgi:nucleotide-binding universal stress UspA family protein
LKNILLALDLKENDTELVKQALAMASKFSSKVWLIHIAAPDPDFVGYGVGPKYIRDARADTLKTEHKQLQQHMLHFEKESIACEALLIAGPTVETLAQEVKKLAVDLLIIGNKRHGFLYETFVGNTTKQIIEELAIPLLLVPIQKG